MMRFKGLFFTFFIFLSIQIIGVKAQDRCGTVEYMSQLNNVESKIAFEEWIQQKRALLPNSGLKSFGAEQTTIYQIPIVVHIIHNGEPVGFGPNITEAQILSQIEVLNEDFRKLNADSVNIPAEFKSLYADIGFEFVLAKRDPNNQSTNGITRTNGGKTIWYQSQDTELKALSYWPSDQYLNIWVVNLSTYLGYAQFPESSLLNGMVPPYTPETDGVVITYDAFGSIEIDPSANLQSNFNLGRTTTHEIGHYFGLRHIWGDGAGDCSIDDYVADTPSQGDNYSGCPSLGVFTTSCGSQDMFMNYMDYVYDNCMNIFTLGQKERMIIVMENSPRRLSLTTSLGLIPPDCEDIALTEVISPGNGICSNTIQPVVTVKNAGFCTVSSVELSLSINGTQLVNQTFATTLDVNQSQDLTFNPVNITDFGNINLTFDIVKVNGVNDTHTDNNTISKNTLYSESVTSLNEDFTISNPQWTIRTNQQVSQWDIEQALSDTDTNTSGVFKYYENNGNSDSYVSPKLVMDATKKTLLFDVAYGYREGYDDQLLVVASTDCGATFPDTLYFASGSDLATDRTPVQFYTSGSLDWRQQQVDLSKYVNQEVIFSFIGNSAGGNRVYLDNIKVVDDTYEDIALAGFNQPAMVCVDDSEASFYVDNKGRSPINSLNLQVVQGTTTITINYSQLNIQPGNRQELPLPIADFSGSTDIVVNLLDSDSNPINNSYSQVLVESSLPIDIPFRENFNESTLTVDWKLTGKGTNQSKGWALENNYLKWNAFVSPYKGAKESIIMPALNLSNVTSASLHFDWSYAFNVTDEELLRVKVSTDCGVSYDKVFEEGGKTLSNKFASSVWTPSSTDDWVDKYIDLSNYAGYDNVWVVIELTSAQGNNAYLDNVELFASNIVEPLALEENTFAIYPNPASGDYVHLSLNLAEKQPIQMAIYSSKGTLVFEKSVENGLNQTFDIPTVDLRSGIYIVKLVGDNGNLLVTKSLYVDN